MKFFRIGIASLLLVGVGCAAGPSGYSSGDDFNQTCASLPKPPEGETVVVMRDQSSSTRVAGVVPVGPDKFGDAVAVVGPVVMTSDGTGVAYAGSESNIEMRPCDPATMKDE